MTKKVSRSRSSTLSSFKYKLVTDRLSVGDKVYVMKMNKNGRYNFARGHALDGRGELIVDWVQGSTVEGIKNGNSFEFTQSPPAFPGFICFGINGEKRYLVQKIMTTKKRRTLPKETPAKFLPQVPAISVSRKRRVSEIDIYLGFECCFPKNDLGRSFIHDTIVYKNNKQVIFEEKGNKNLYVFHQEIDSKGDFYVDLSGEMELLINNEVLQFYVGVDRSQKVVVFEGTESTEPLFDPDDFSVQPHLIECEVKRSKLGRQFTNSRPRARKE